MIVEVRQGCRMIPRLRPIPTDRDGAVADFYQIFTWVSPLRTMASPGLQANALANVSMFDGAPIAR